MDWFAIYDNQIIDKDKVGEDNMAAVESTKAADKTQKAADINTIFATNEDFHLYVIKHCRLTGDTIEQALRKKIIQEVAKEYIKGGCNYREKGENNGTNT